MWVLMSSRVWLTSIACSLCWVSLADKIYLTTCRAYVHYQSLAVQTGLLHVEVQT